MLHIQQYLSFILLLYFFVNIKKKKLKEKNIYLISKVSKQANKYKNFGKLECRGQGLNLGILTSHSSVPTTRLPVLC